MLCSNCSHKVKPVVAVDIDGTIGNYHLHFICFAEEYLGRGPRDIHNVIFNHYDGKGLFRDWFTEVYEVSVEIFRDIKLAYRQGGMKRTMPMFSWADRMIELFRAEGAEVWITTTRPYLRLDNVDPDTREWLSRNGIEFDGLIYDKYKYKILSERIDPNRVVAVLEDLLDKVNEAGRIFGYGNVFWRRTPYNEGKGEGGYDSLTEITDLVVPKIKEWNQNNG